MNHIEEFIPNVVNECNTCRQSDSINRLKLIKHSNQIDILKNEEKKLKIFHQHLEKHIKQYLHRTRNSILTEEKLLNIEKCSQKELLIRENLIHQKKSSKKESNILWNNIQQIEKENQNLEKNISSLCIKIKQLENNTQYKFQQTNNHHKTSLIQIGNQLHRMNLELNKICSNNKELRLDIKYMLDKRHKMIEEYNRFDIEMENVTNELHQLTLQCSESFANRRNLIARMRLIRDQDEYDEKKLLDDIRELDRLVENNNTSKNFLVKKSNIRQEQIQMNELFAGKRLEGIKYAYTANEFHRLFRIYFNQDFLQEKILNRTVETFLNEQEQSFILFEYSVELINELDHLHKDLEMKRKYISDMFSNDNIKSFVIKDIFSILENSVNEVNNNVESFKIAKNNLRYLLDHAYELILNLFFELHCDQNRLFSLDQSINDRNILLYLATIESRVQQLLNINQNIRTNQDYTTISWKIDHQNIEQIYNSTKENNRNVLLHRMDFITPKIPSIEEIPVINDERDNKEKTLLPEEIVNSVLNVYNECIDRLDTNLKDNVTVIVQTDEIK